MYEFSRHSGPFTRFPATLETSKFKKGYRRENVNYFLGKKFLRNIFFMKIIPLSCWLLFFRYVHKISKASASFVTSVLLSTWNNSAPIGRIFVKIYIDYFLKKSNKKIQISLKSDKNNRYFTQRPMYILDHISLISS